MGRSQQLVRVSRVVLAGVLGLAIAGPGNSETLDDVVASALQTNPRVSQARAEQAAAGLDVRQARGGYFPSVDLNGGIGPEDSNIKQLKLSGGDNGTLTRREFGLTLRQMIYDGFATRSEVGRRTALLTAAEQGTRDVRESVAFDTVQVYLSVLRNQELVGLAQANVRAHEKVLSGVERKVKQGVIEGADLDQAQGRLARAKSALTARQGALAEAISNYERVVGTLPGQLAKPEASSSGLADAGSINMSRVEQAIANAISDAESMHPALLQARAELEASEAAISVARAAYHPRVDLEANASRNANLSGVEGIRNSNTIMVVGRWNVFRGGSDRAAEQAAVQRRFAAEERIADIRRIIAENVGVALKARATTEARLEHLKAHVSASEQTRVAYQKQFNLGKRTLLDSLNAETELFTARSSLVSGQFDDLLNQYFVEAAKGQLVRSFGLNNSAP